MLFILEVLGTVGKAVSMLGKMLVLSDELEDDAGLGLTVADFDKSSDIVPTAVVWTPVINKMSNKSSDAEITALMFHCTFSD